METFQIELKLENKRLSLQAQQLDTEPDEDGFVRFAVSGERGRSVVALGRSYWERPFVMTEQDAWDYLEALLYPEFSGLRSEDELFTRAEQEHIAQEISKKVRS